MLPDRPSLEEAIKNGMHKSVLKTRTRNFNK